MSADLAKSIDHTLLKPDATSAQIAALCAEAVECGFFSVCVNGCWIPAAREALAGTEVCVVAVTGFPLGASAPGAKAEETAHAVRLGADEIDAVINIGFLLGGERRKVLADLRGVVEAAAGRPVKAIIETALLGREQKIEACRLAVEAGVAFVKTSTGFAGGGATVEDVRLIKETVGDACRVKASGGIRDRATALALLEAGATRLGTSSGVAIVRGSNGGGGY